MSSPTTPKNLPPQFEIIHANTRELIEQCITVRLNVFVHEQQFPLESEVDEYDDHPDTVHLLLRLLPLRNVDSDSASPIGTLRFHPTSSTKSAHSGGKQLLDGISYYRLGRVCILEPYRKYKLGAKLIEAAHTMLRKELLVDPASHPNDVDNVQEDGEGGGGARSIIEVELHSQIPAMGFYARCGYEAFGDEFMEDDQPHVAMRIVIQL